MKTSVAYTIITMAENKLGTRLSVKDYKAMEKILLKYAPLKEEVVRA